MQKKKRLYSCRKERKREMQKSERKKLPKNKYQRKRKEALLKEKVKTKLKLKQWILTDVRCPICDMKWEDDDGKNGQWLGCECGQWLHEDCIEYDLV